MFDSNESDNDGDDLCVEVAGRGSSWNPDGIAIATEFSNSKAILDAVDDLAHRFNKEVGLLPSSYFIPHPICLFLCKHSQWQERLGGHSKVFVCKHFIQVKLAYELRIKQKYPDSWKEYLQSHKFTGGHGACHFMASFTKKRRSKAKGMTKDIEGDDANNTWKLVPARTLLQHSAHCSAVGKIKSRQLMRNPGFRNAVVANGKASCNQLTR